MTNQHLSIESITEEHVAEACGVSIDELRRVASNPDLLFRARTRRRIKGKDRRIDPPTALGRRLLKRLHRILQRVCPPNRIVHGGAIGRSCFSSASEHCGRHLTITRDIFRCYPSIDRVMMFDALVRRGFTSSTASLIADLLIIRGCVSQGSPASGSALNILLFDFDNALHSFAIAHSLAATRTYDDIIVSSDNVRDREAIETFLTAELRRMGLAFSRKKARAHGLQLLTGKDGRATVVHSLVTSRPGGVAIGERHRNLALDAARRYIASCRCVNSSTLESTAKLREKVVGWLRYVGQARYGPHRNIKQIVSAGDRLVEKRLAKVGVCTGAKAWHSVHPSANEPRRLARLWPTH